jgi:hypothetical protein
VFLLWPPPIHPICQMSRQRQIWKGWGLWRGRKGSSSLAHMEKQITIHFVHLWLLPLWGFRCLLAIVSL